MAQSRDETGAASGEEYLVPVVGLAAILDEHIGVRLEEGHYFLCCWYLLAVEDASRRLGNHALDE